MAKLKTTRATSFNNTNDKQSKPVGPTVKMKTETAGKIGLFGAISIIIGTVFGVGIFLKNESVFRSNNANPLGVLLSWGIVFIIAFATAFSYGEITRVRTKTANSGLAGWSERYVGYNFGRFLKITYPFFYYSIYTFALSLFFAEGVLCINPNFIGEGMPSITNQSLWLLWGVGFGIALIMLLSNWLNSFAVQKSMSFISPIKFIPVIMVIIFGVWGGVKNGGGYFTPSYEGEYSGKFTIFGVFDSLPAIMFAFDSFLIVGNISSNVKNPTKNVPISIIVSMVISGVFYFIVTISQLLCGCGNPYSLFNTLFKDQETLKTTFKIIISIFLAISLFGCVTSLSSALTNTTQSAIDEEVIIGSRVMKKIANGSKNKLTGGFIMSIIIVSFWFFTFGIISAILNTDQIFDGLSNIAVVLMFTIYGFVTFMSIINRFTQRVPKTEVSYQKGQVPFAIIGALGCFAVPLYQMIYVFIIQVAEDPFKEYTTWGLFWDIHGHEINRLIASCIFWSGTILFIAWPFINDLLIKATNKNYSQTLLWEKAKVNKNIEIRK